MKTAIIYYSLSGNAAYVADIVSKELTADVLSLQVKKEYPKSGFRKFYWGGKSAVMGEEPELMEYDIDLNAYDLIILGTPVWAGTFTPPLRTFIKENRNVLKDKKIAVFACHSGGGAEKMLKKLKDFIGIDKLEAQLILTDPKDKETPENKEKILTFCQDLHKDQ